MTLLIESKAPDFSLPNQDNQTVRLEDFLGRWLIIYFYPKDDTPGCTVEACNFRDEYVELKKAGIAVLGISKDSVSSHKKFHSKFKLNFDILADPDKVVIEAYDAWQAKIMYGKTFMGIKRMTYLINPEGKISHIWPKVTPKEHAAQILSYMKGQNSQNTRF